MKINPEKTSTKMETMIYEKPSLEKYGTMKELTSAIGGSFEQNPQGKQGGDHNNPNMK